MSVDQDVRIFKSYHPKDQEMITTSLLLKDCTNVAVSKILTEDQQNRTIQLHRKLQELFLLMVLASLLNCKEKHVQVDPGLVMNTESYQDTLTEPLLWVETKPKFIGSYEKFLKENIRYPSNGQRKEGVVVVQYVLGKDSSINYVQVIKGLGDEFDEEAIRVVMLMDKKWTPGRVGGRAYDYQTMAPIRFKLPE